MTMENTTDTKPPASPPFPAPTGSAVLPINYEWNPDDPRCVRCGDAMFLLDGCEWADDPAENLCHTCALGAVNDLRRLVAYLEQQNVAGEPQPPQKNH